jgi:hypothetical protein
MGGRYPRALVRAQCELPGFTTLDELTKKIRTEVNRGFFTLVSGRVDAAAPASLGRLHKRPQSEAN